MVSIMFVVSFAPRGNAAFVATGDTITQEMRADDLSAVRKTLENKKVVERLKTLGYSPQEIRARISQLSDEELHKLSTRIENVSSGGVIGVIIGVLLIVLLVVVIMEIEDDEIQIE
jgi:hypothetical protein